MRTFSSVIIVTALIISVVVLGCNKSSKQVKAFNEVRLPKEKEELFNEGIPHVIFQSILVDTTGFENWMGSLDGDKKTIAQEWAEPSSTEVESEYRYLTKAAIQKCASATVDAENQADSDVKEVCEHWTQHDFDTVIGSITKLFFKEVKRVFLKLQGSTQ